MHRVWAMSPNRPKKKGAQGGTAGALQGAEGVDQESKSWQKKGAQDGTPGALQGAQDTVWRIIRPDQFPSIESLQLCVIRKLQP